MQFTLHVHASLAAGSGSPTPETLRSAEVVASAASVRLRDVVSVDYDITFVEADGSPRELHVMVSFPDEARALLQELSWRQAQSIVDTVFEIGAAYAARSVASRLAGATGLSADATARIPTALYMPLGSFRDGLEAVGGSAAGM
jgi:hypothetical protein